MSDGVRRADDSSDVRPHHPSQMNKSNAHPADVANAGTLAELVLAHTRHDRDLMPDPVVVASDLGVPILEVPASRLAGARGLTSWHGGGYVIEIDDSLPEPERQLVAGHELGHVACKLWNVVPFNWERFAWLFAGALLVRAEWAADMWRRSEDLSVIFAALPHVPPTAVALAIGEHGIANVAVTQWKDIRYTRAREVMPSTALDAGMAATKTGQPTSRVGVRAWRLDDMPGRAAVVAVASAG